MVNQNTSEDELSLLDIYRILKAYRKSILLAPFLISILAVLVSWLFIEPCYKAYGTIQLGKVNGRMLEDGFVLQERMKDMSFISEVILQHPNLFNYEKNLAAEETWLINTLEVKKNKETDLVTFSLLAHNPERAKLKAQAIIDTIRIKHNKLYGANVQIIRSQIDMLEKQIESILNDSKSVRMQLHGSRSLSYYNTVVGSLILNSQSDQLREFTTKKLELEEALNLALTFNTQLLGDIYVSRNPVSPNIPLIAVVAFLLGLFGAIFMAFIRHSLK